MAASDVARTQPWWTGRYHRDSAARRDQKRRKSGRQLQDVVKDRHALGNHRGCRRSKLGEALFLVLTSESGSSRTLDTAAMAVPRPEEVPHTRLAATDVCAVERVVVDTSEVTGGGMYGAANHDDYTNVAVDGTVTRGIPDVVSTDDVVVDDEPSAHLHETVEVPLLGHLVGHTVVEIVMEDVSPSQEDAATHTEHGRAEQGALSRTYVLDNGKLCANTIGLS